MNYISYCVSYAELMQKWIEENHMSDYIVVIYDPLTHIKLLRDMKVEVDELNLFSSKVMIVFFINLEDSLKFFDQFEREKGPFIQAWALGYKVRENY